MAGLSLMGLLLASTAAVAALSGGSHAKAAAPNASIAPAAGQVGGVLAATIAPDTALEYDGDGVATVALADISSTDVTVGRIRADILVSAPARVTAVRGASGWRCTVRSPGSVGCSHTGVVVSSRGVAPITLEVRAVGSRGRPSFGRARLRVRATWIQADPGGQLLERGSAATLAVTERAPLTVTARSAVPTVTEPINGLPTTPMILQGSVGGRTPEPVRFQWRQVCDSGSCPRVRWTSATQGVLVDGQQPAVGFDPPSVNASTVLRFALTASDPRGAVTAVTSVRAQPDQIEQISPRLAGLAFTSAALRSNQRPVTAVPLTKADQAVVTVNGPGVTQTRVDSVVVLTARVQDQHISRAGWSVAVGPRSMLAGARRSGATIRFRAPAVPGTYAVRMTATTAAGSFTRDQLVEVNPNVPAKAAAASVDTGRQRAFCAVLAEARTHGRISISLPSGAKFTADTNRPAGNGTECSGTETIDVRSGTTTLGSFELTQVHGSITRDRGLVIAGGTLMTPGFWAAPPQSAADTSVHAIHSALDAEAGQAGAGLAIPFSVPRMGDITVGLDIPLTDTGFSDLSGQITLNQSALSKFPLSSSLPEANQPAGWRMTNISLAVVPEARRFELIANAKGPQSTDGELSFYGLLTFDGQLSLSVVASNLAVFDSSGGQRASVTAQGTVTMLPGRRIDSAGKVGSSVFPVIDVEVSAAINDYRPAQNVTLSGQISWSSNGPFEIAGTLLTAMKNSPMRFTVTGSFTDANNWKLYAELQTGDNGLELGTPPLLKLKLLTGTLSRHGGEVQISLKGEATDIKAIEGVHVSSAAVEFTTSCQFSGETSAISGRVCLLVELHSELTLPGKSPLKVSGAVKVDFSTGKFEASGQVALKPDDPLHKAFGLHNVEMFVTNAGPPRQAVCKVVARTAAGDGLYFGLTAQGKVLGLPLHFTGAYLGGDHFCLAANIGTASLPTGNSDQLTTANGQSPPASEPPASCAAENAPTLQHLSFEYSSDTKEGRFSGKFCLPSGVRRELGNVGSGVGTVDLFLSDNGFEGRAAYRLARVVWFLNALNHDTPDPKKAALGFREMTFRVDATRTAGLSLGLNAAGELSMPAPTAASGGMVSPGHGQSKGSTARVSVGVTVALRPAPQLTIEANTGQSTSNEPCNRARAAVLGIVDAFNAPGFDICQFGFDGTVGLSGFSLGVNASFTLPRQWGPELGVNNASFRIGFRISAQDPCINLEIDKANANGPSAIDLLNKGVIVADQATFRIAPNGCTLPGSPPLNVPAGIRLAFAGTMFGTPTKVNLEITRKDPGLKINFTQETGASSLGPLKFGASKLQVLLDPGPPAQTKLELHTSMAIGNGGGVLIDGVFNHAAGRTTLDASACLITRLPPANAPSGTPPPCGTVTLLGASFSGRLALKFDTGTGAGGLEAKFSGRLSADLRFLAVDVEVKNLLYAGGLQELDVSVNTGFKLGPVEGHIGGSVTYLRAQSEIGLTLSGRVKLWGFETAFHLPAKLSTNISLPFEFGPGNNTTRISKPGTLLVLRLKGDLTGHVARNGSIGVTHLMTIQGCFPFETVCVDVDKQAQVDTATGTVKFTVFGFGVTIDASQYIKNTPGQVDYSPGISYVANDASGKCLDVNFGNFSNGTRIKEEQCSRTRNIAQEFKLLADGTLRVRSDGGKEFCVSGVNREPQLAGCDASRSDERWIRDNKGQILGNAGNTAGLCLDVNSQTKFTTLSGACGKSGRWVIVDMIQRPGVGCLDLPHGNLSSELKVFPTCNRSVNQAFALYPNGELKVRGLCVAAGEIKAGAAVKLADCNGSKPQLWFLDLGVLCTGAVNGFDYRQAQCMGTQAKQGDYFPVRLSPLDINGKRNPDPNLRWDVTY